MNAKVAVNPKRSPSELVVLARAIDRLVDVAGVVAAAAARSDSRQLGAATTRILGAISDVHQIAEDAAADGATW